MELFDLYDENRLPLNRTAARGTKLNEGEFRLTVHVCIFTPDGKMLCQRRQPFKRGFPDMWDVSVGGCVVAGETTQMAAARETAEELGLSVNPQRPVLTVHFENGFDDWFCVQREVDPASCVLQQSEVAEVATLTCEEILQRIDAGKFVPYKKDLIRLLFSLSECGGSFQSWVKA